MLKCSKEAVLGAVLCAVAVTAWGGPVELPVPATTTAATPAAAVPIPAIAPPASTAGAPAVATAPLPPPTPPKPRGVDYSYVDASMLLVQPFGNEDVGHGEKLTVSDALSDGAFMILDGARFDSIGEVRHSFDVGFGLDMHDDPTRSFYATATWTGVGFSPTAAPGSSGHGFALAGGVRVQPLPSVELDAEARYDSNPALDGHTAGSLGMLYEFTNRLWLGFTLGTNAMENDYLLTLRWTFGK